MKVSNLVFGKIFYEVYILLSLARCVINTKLCDGLGLELGYMIN